MVVPLLVWGGVVAVTALSGATYFGLKGQEPDKQISNNYSTTNQYQTKKTALTLGDGAKIGSVSFKDSMSQSATVEQKSEQQGNTSSLLSNPLVLAGGAVAVAYILTRGK